MIHEERIEEIRRVLARKNIVSLGELCEALYCSKSTVRRDLLEMENAGLVHRTRGGAMLISDRSVEQPTGYRLQKNQDKKDHIAGIAKRYLDSDSFIFLDASTTVRALTRYITRLNNVSVVTNSISMANELGQYANLTVLIPGGRVLPGHDAMLGLQTMKSLEVFAFDLALFSCKNLDENGVYEADYEQALIKKNMLQQSRRSILLCDSTKIGGSSFYNFAKPKEFSSVVTDPGLTRELLSRIAQVCKLEY